MKLVMEKEFHSLLVNVCFATQATKDGMVKETSLIRLKNGKTIK